MTERKNSWPKIAMSLNEWRLINAVASLQELTVFSAILQKLYGRIPRTSEQQSTSSQRVVHRLRKVAVCLQEHPTRSCG
jgi:hypothetical protein